MAIQMRRGQLANYDKSKMLPGEWGISIDNDSDNQKAFISFAPGVSKEVMMVEDAEEQIAVATAEAIDMATEEAEAWAHGNSFHVNDYASGDGSTRAFTLAETPSSILGVYVNGSSVSAYTLSGKTITFTTAPASGSNNIRVYYTVNTTTDNAKYYKEQAKAVADSIPEDYSDLSDDVDQLKNAITTKAEQDGAYPDLTAGQMLSKVEQTDSVPYNFRAVGQDSTLEYTDAIVGGSVVWNQLAKEFSSENWINESGVSASYADGVATISTTTAGNGIMSPFTTIENNHVYYIGITAKCSATIGLRFGVASVALADDTFPKASFSRTENIKKASATESNRIALYGKNTTYTDLMAKDAEFIDLTQMFGTAIADFLYSLGSEVGVAWLRKRFPKMFTYQPYNAGEIVSVQGLSQHVTTGKNKLNVTLSTRTTNGVTFTNNGDGTVKLNGTATAYTFFNLNYAANTKSIPTGSYIFSGMVSGITTRVYSDGSAIFNYQGTTEQPFTISESSAVTYARIDIGTGTSFNNVTYKPMIRLASVSDATFAPYVSHTYPLDSSLTLRGIPKLTDSDGSGDVLSIIDTINLYYDGDRYLPDGTVQRRYGVVDLGTLNWSFVSASEWNCFSTRISDKAKGGRNFMCAKYAHGDVYGTDTDKIIIGNTSNAYIYIRDTSYTDAATFKAAMSGVYLVYKLATPTTEEADPYTVPQIVDPNGTEEYVSTSIVPVGHESRYPLDIAGRLDKILTMPTANGTYTLRATVNNGAVTYAWVST